MPRYCSNCEFELPEDASGVPCPECGSTKHNIVATPQPGSFALTGGTINVTVGAAQFNAPDAPSLLLQSVVERGDKTTDGEIILAAAVPWFKIVEMMQRDPEFAHQINWRTWEEIIAGAYAEQGFDVILTPRSNDKGRDVIATLKGLRIRYFDQVKAYKPGHLVKLEDVHAMLGVLTAGQNVSKGIVTTTSDFAPGVLTNDELKRLMPYRLELKPRDVLLKELSDIAAGKIQRE